MKALICGGRNVGRTNPNAVYLDAAKEIQRASEERKFVIEKLAELYRAGKFSSVIGGKEGGAERLATHWAAINGIPVEIIVRRSGRETIERRNMRMLDEGRPELLIALGGGPGTQSLIAEARRRGIMAIEVDIPAF
jgi:hypothetical protein